MWLLIQIKAILVAPLSLLFILFPAALVAAPFSLDRRLKIICPAWGAFARSLLRYGAQAKVDICEDHRSPEFKTTPAYGLYVANHQSYIDIPLILSVFQVPPIMKKEVMYIPIFGWIGWISGALPISRSNSNSRKKVFDMTKKRILKDKIGMQVYPEGTRSKDARPKSLKEIRPTLLIFAYKEKIPVIPVSMYGTRGVLSKFGTVNAGRHLGIIVHKEISPLNFANAEEFCEAVWGKVIQGHDQMEVKLAPLNENLSLAEAPAR